MTTRWLSAAVMACSVCGAQAGDWPAWRGPDQTGRSRQGAAVTCWSPDGDNLLWKLPFGGRTTPIVMGGRIFFIAPVGQGVGRRERVICLEADTGKTVWEHRFNVYHTDIVENRVGWTAVAADPETGNVYAHGTGGELFCWDRDGQVIWKISMTEVLGRISGYGGRLMTPLIDEDRVVVSYLSSGWGAYAKGAHRYFAFDKRNGDIVWISTLPHKPLDTTYATPAVGVIGGKRMLVCPAADGYVYGLLARTGQIVWKYKLSKRGLNVSAVIDGDRAYVGHSEENYTTTEMGAVVCLDASRTGDITETGVIWRIDGLAVGYCSPALARDRLYVVTNNARLVALDARDGRRIWEYGIGRVGKGSPVVTPDGVIYVGEQNGVFHILKDEGEKCVSLDRQTFVGPNGEVDEFYGSPAVVDGRVYFMTRYATYCLAATVSIVDQGPPEPIAETAGGDGPNPTLGHVLIVPAEVTMAPGERRQFELRCFTPDGRRTTTTAEAKWSVSGLNATEDADGALAHSVTIAPGGTFDAGALHVECGGLKASARIRVSPPLPIQETFDDMPIGSIPPGWVGTGGGPKKKIQVVELDGQKVLVKQAKKERPSPPFMRLRAYATPPLAGGYTVVCDLMSRVRDAGRRSYQPDMGLINSRYRCILLGADKKRGKTNKLRIETWGPLPRLRQDVEVDWDPDVWYTLKFEVAPAEGQARCRAKFWPRGQAEPDDWRIQVADPYPNTEGSAGLYCYSTGTTSKSDGPVTYFDNFAVLPNEP